ncbi:ABC transporter permease [Aureimonas sp. SA4125]|uniref:AI-2E family transporter n=1 Tax=Aureimonas sp. SA4125 TaxID=2826993 RepID=UPI001CC68CEC|nr:AI-2E family transporter [Aureimonas sp. SA4125]BDA85272.1 ABC transporter permease [Aureimonas sp. SA4125]
MPTPSRLPETMRSDIPAIAPGAGLQSLAVSVVVIAALYFGRDIFVPLALATLLSFALAPIISKLRRLHVPRTPAVIFVVLMAFIAILGFGALVAGQVSQLGSNLPKYQYNIQTKIRDLRSSATGGGVIEHASEMLQKLSEEIDEPDEAPASTRATTSTSTEPAPPEPIPVRIQQPDPAPFEMLQTIVGPLISPLATGGVVIVFVIFILLQREDLRDRFIRLAGGNDLHRTTRALSDAGKRVAKYLLMQLVVNTTYGIPIGVGLWFIGVPNPLLWGMLATVLRFVPYIGPFIAMLFPMVLAVAVDPGWSMLFWTASLFIGIELVSNNVVEPWLYGASTGLSSVAIIVAAIFWTWLWGPIGLLLSTPLTVCLVVLGEHVPQFSFLHVLLGSQPVLSPHEQIYQRLLAGDPYEATEKAEDYLEEHSLRDFYDDVALPALALVEQDRARGVLDEVRRARVADGARTLVDNLSDHQDVVPAEADVEPKDTPESIVVEGEEVPPLVYATRPGWEKDAVLCAGGRGNLDDVASEMLAQVLSQDAIGTQAVSFEELAAEKYTRLDLQGVQMICLSFMNAESVVHARYLVRRLRRRTSVPILVGFWSLPPGEADRLELVKTTRADMSATTLAEAITQIEARAKVAVEQEAIVTPETPDAATVVAEDPTEPLAPGWQPLPG